MYDLLITGGRIIDGSGGPWYWADLAVQGDRIVEIGNLIGTAAKTTVKADSRIVCPGFVDMHTHSDLQLLANPIPECKIRQGITTEVLGHDGLGLAPVTPETADVLRRQLAGWNGSLDVDWNWSTITTYLDRFEGTTAVNVAMLIPHGTIRMAVVGLDNQPPTEPELHKMSSLVAQGMEEGAVGLSTGLTYVPAMYASDEEVVALCKALRPFNGFYCPHHRNYGPEVLQANYDCIETARLAGVPLHLTHCHVSTEANKGRASELLSAIDKARQEGVEITLDSYPYLAGNTYLHSLLPGWVQEGGTDATIRRLGSSRHHARLRHEMEVSGSDGFFGMPLGWEIIQIGSILGKHDPTVVGLSVPEAAARCQKPPFEFFIDLLVETDLGVSCFVHIGDEGNVRTIMKHPAHMVASDAILVGDRPHPRGWGAHVRFLSRYVRDLQLLTWEEGIRKMTSAATRRLGFLDRGILRPGAKADLLVLDPDELQDTATYENPISNAEGIHFVAVNGEATLLDGEPTGSTPGCALREPYGRNPKRITETLSEILGEK